ncbi:hypothetical protein NUSPORA_01920 [Nucleospora cyclopteri]
MQQQSHVEQHEEGQVKKLKLVRRKKVTWSEDTIDNSEMDKKSSKICCIFHREQHNEPSEKNKYERG